MTDELQKFIVENINLINSNTYEDWVNIYTQLKDKYPKEMCGGFTSVMLKSGIDPSHVIGHIPEYFLYFTSIKEYIIDPQCTQILDRAFEQTLLKELNIPSNVTIIGLAAFRATHIRKLTLPHSVRRVRNLAFSSCSELEEVDLGQVRSLGNSVFNYCPKLTKVVIPTTLTELPLGSFYMCSKLKEIIYLGTMEQFENMVKDELEDWTNRYRIVCSDGVIE